MIRLAIAAAMLLPLPSTASQPVAEVPSQFIGVWMGSPASCDSERDDLALQLERKRISYWESNGPIKAIVVHGNNEIALIAELSDEGESWLTTAQFKLSPAGDKLIDDTSIPGKEVVRYKCPKLDGSRSNNSFKPNPHRGTAWVLIRYASTQSPPRCGPA